MIGLKGKTAVAGAGLLLCASPAFAVTIDGISVPNGTGIHELTSDIYEPDLSNGVLSGYGRVTTIDGDLSSKFANGGELTFVYDNYVAQAQNEAMTAGDFKGGNIDFYAGDSANFSNDDPSTASDGALFLSTTGDTAPNLDDDNTLQGTSLNPGSDESQNTALGHLDVVDGSAASVFDTDGYSDGNGGTSDLLFNATYSPDDGGPAFSFSGSADARYRGETPENVVPEPSELALLGFGSVLLLLGLGWRRRGDQ